MLLFSVKTVLSLVTVSTPCSTSCVGVSRFWLGPGRLTFVTRGCQAGAEATWSQLWLVAGPGCGLGDAVLGQANQADQYGAEVEEGV